jgi:hypothetical protein
MRIEKQDLEVKLDEQDLEMKLDNVMSPVAGDRHGSRSNAEGRHNCVVHRRCPAKLTLVTWKSIAHG